MVEVTEPFATVDDLRARWPDMPIGSDATAEVLLLDASQYIMDVCPAAATASDATKRRVVCSIVRRAMTADQSPAQGAESYQLGAGPYQETFKPINPHGDLYLTGQEKRVLGCGRPRAFVIDPLAGRDAG